MSPKMNSKKKKKRIHLGGRFSTGNVVAPAADARSRERGLFPWRISETHETRGLRELENVISRTGRTVFVFACLLFFRTKRDRKSPVPSVTR